MKIRPEQLDIPVEKITEYLLAKKEKNDKLKSSLIITIWLEQVNKDIYRFITLYPDYGKEI